MALKNSKILKVAGLSFVGFCAVSIGVDRINNLGPLASQIAGFCGAFVGGWVGARRQRAARSKEVSTNPPVPVASTPEDRATETQTSGIVE
jgi:hypothetical protein